MSDVVLPSLPGVAITITKTPKFETRIKRAVSGTESRAAFMAYPLWKFSLSFAFLRHGAENELRQLLGFFLARRGSFDSFLYTDPEDNAVTDQSFGTGDGTTTQFQLARTFGYGAGALFTDPVQNVNALTNIKKAGVVQSSPAQYSINATGLVTFAAAPAAGNALTWSGSYYYRVRFEKDEADFERFLQDLFSLKRLEFTGALSNKV